MRAPERRGDFASHEGGFEVVTRPGSGGPRRLDGILVCRSRALDSTTLEGIPITTPERTLIDLAPHLDDRALARAVREACRLNSTTPSDLFVALARSAGRRGTRRLHAAVSRYAGLPLHRTRSDAEALALELLRDAGRPPPDVNERVCGAEADLIWPQWRLIVELDGPQFHLDASEDLRKQRAWEAGGWTVRRLGTDDVYLHPERLLAFAKCGAGGARWPHAETARRAAATSARARPGSLRAMLSVEDVRRLALGLPEATEQDHHGRPSFRVGNRIFATLWAPRALNVMAGEELIRAAVERSPESCSEVRWGKRLAAVQIDLRTAGHDQVEDLLYAAWSRRAPPRLNI